MTAERVDLLTAAEASLRLRLDPTTTGKFACVYVRACVYVCACLCMWMRVRV